MGVVSWNGSMTRCYAHGPVELFLMKECRWRVCVWAFDAFTGRTPFYSISIPNVTRTSYKQSISFCNPLSFLLDSATNLSGMFGSPVLCHDMSAHLLFLFCMRSTFVVSVLYAKWVSILKYRLGMVCFQAASRFSSVTVDRSVCCARYMSCSTCYFAIACDIWIPKQESN